MAGPPNAKVTADIRKNRLFFRISGIVFNKDLDRLYTDVRFCVADLKPGFHVITDLTECRFSNLNCIATFRKIMHYLMEKQVGQVIRITRGTSLIHKQIRNLSARFQGYNAVYVSCLEEAERYLEESSGPHGLTFHLHQAAVSFSANTIKGTGYIREISTARCSIDFVTSELRVGEEILLRLEFSYAEEAARISEIRATVTHLETDHFIADFQDLSEEQRSILRNCIVREVQKET